MKEILESLTLTPDQIAKLIKLCSGDWGKLATLSASNAGVFSQLTGIAADVVPMLNTLANIYAPAPTPQAQPAPTPQPQSDDDDDELEMSIRRLVRMMSSGDTSSPVIEALKAKGIKGHEKLFAVADGKIDFYGSMHVIRDERHSGLAQYDGKALLSLDEIGAKFRRVNPFTLTPIVKGDRWDSLTDDQLLLVHYAFIKGHINTQTSQADVWREASTGKYEFTLHQSALTWSAIKANKNHPDVLAATQRMYSVPKPQVQRNAVVEPITYSTVTPQTLRMFITSHLNIQELTLCLDGMSVSHEEIGGGTLQMLALNAVQYFNRRGQLLLFAAHVRNNNPTLFDMALADTGTVATGNNNVVAGNRGVAIQGAVVGNITVGGDFVGRDKITIDRRY